MHRLHRESGEERAEPISFQQYQRWHPSSSSSSWWNSVKNWSSYFTLKFCSFLYSWWQSAATDGRCKQYTSHVTFSRSQRALVMMCETTLAQVCVRVIPSMCHAPEWLSVLSSILTLLSSASFSIFHFFLNLDFYLFLFHVDVFGARSFVHFAQWGVWHLGQ